MEMEKISGLFPFVNRNPEFHWKPNLKHSWVNKNIDNSDILLDNYKNIKGLHYQIAKI